MNEASQGVADDGAKTVISALKLLVCAPVVTLLLGSSSLCLRRMSKLVLCKIFPKTFVFKSYTITFRSLENLREVSVFSVPLLLFSSVLTKSLFHLSVP